MIRGAIGQRLNGARRLAASGHETAAIHDEEVRDIVRTVVRIDHRGLRIVAHATGAHQVSVRQVVHIRLVRPKFLGAGGLEDFHLPFEQELHRPHIIRMIVEGDPHRRQAPRVLDLWI